MNGTSCCTPSANRDCREERPVLRVSAPAGFSTDGMSLIAAGDFLMGGKGSEIWPTDGESPVREISLDSFWIDQCA